MHLGHPLRSIALPLDAGALEVLAGTTRPMSGRQIGRVMGEGSANGVWKALDRLETAGLALADRRGSAIYWTANREHLAWPAIEALVGLRRELLSRIEAAVRAWPIAPVHASVFGSFARGDADETSDIDLLLVRPEGLGGDEIEAWETQLDALRDSVLRWSGNRAQTFDVDLARLAEHVAAGDPLVSAWLADGRHVAGRPIRELVDETRRR